MSLFELPTGLEQIAHFSLLRVQTWVTSRDQEYKESVRKVDALPLDSRSRFAWFTFTLRCMVAESRGRVEYQIPDVEIIPNLIVDAFTGLLYPDDHIHYVRGVQVEAEFGPVRRNEPKYGYLGN